MRCWWLLGLLACSTGKLEQEQHCESRGEAAGPACLHSGRAYLEGVSVSKDVVRADALWRIGCELRHGESCLALAVGWADGALGPPVASQSERWAARACQAGNQGGCLTFARNLAARGEVDAARTAWKQACQHGDDHACNVVDGQETDPGYPALPTEATPAQAPSPTTP